MATTKSRANPSAAEKVFHVSPSYRLTTRRVVSTALVPTQKVPKRSSRIAWTSSFESPSAVVKVRHVVPA